MFLPGRRRRRIGGIVPISARVRRRGAPIRAQENIAYEPDPHHYWLSGWAARELQHEWRTPVVHMFHTLGRMKDLVAQNNDQHEADNRAK
jgi:hypothetical protein